MKWYVQGANTNVLDKEGRSSLLLAGARAAWKSVVALIELGSNVSLRDKCNRNLFHHIVLSGGNLDKFTELISKVVMLFCCSYIDFIFQENSRTSR